jgi:hypothetical protein
MLKQRFQSENNWDSVKKTKGTDLMNHLIFNTKNMRTNFLKGRSGFVFHRNFILTVTFIRDFLEILKLFLRRPFWERNFVVLNCIFFSSVFLYFWPHNQSQRKRRDFVRSFDAKFFHIWIDGSSLRTLYFGRQIGVSRRFSKSKVLLFLSD